MNYFQTTKKAGSLNDRVSSTIRKGGVHVSVNERRAEIMKILVARRQTTVPLLAQELCVCCNTVRNDIHVLALDYPLETCSGNGGGVRVADWYHPYKNMLTEEQSVALEQLLLFADIRQAEVIRQILAEFSSQTYRQKYAKE